MWASSLNHRPRWLHIARIFDMLVTVRWPAGPRRSARTHSWSRMLVAAAKCGDPMQWSIVKKKNQFSLRNYAQLKSLSCTSISLDSLDTWTSLDTFSRRVACAQKCLRLQFWAFFNTSLWRARTVGPVFPAVLFPVTFLDFLCTDRQESARKSHRACWSSEVFLGFVSPKAKLVCSHKTIHDETVKSDQKTLCTCHRISGYEPAWPSNTHQYRHHIIVTVCILHRVPWKQSTTLCCLPGCQTAVMQYGESFSFNLIKRGEVIWSKDFELIIATSGRYVIHDQLKWRSSEERVSLFDGR